MKYLLVILCCIASIANSKDIKVALQSEVTSIDPHYHINGPNLAMARHVFDPLVIQDNHQKLRSGLATSWRKIDDVTWEFDLRKGVTFHDGKEFTAADVIFSLERARSGVSPFGSFTLYTKHIKDIVALETHKVRITSHSPYPLLAWDLAIVAIVSSKAAKNATTEDFNYGKAAVGTGPYKFKLWKQGEKIELESFDHYWGGKEPWQHVTFLPIGNDVARLNALKAGDVDLIESVPVYEVDRIKKDEKYSHYATMPNRLIYLALDSGRDISPFVSDKMGSCLKKNPLKDIRVRQAISFAMDRKTLIDKFLAGLGTPAGQIVPPGSFGSDDALEADEFNPKYAKRLLKESGYPEGFAMTLQGPKDRYTNDVKVLQAVAVMLSQIGIKSKAETFPSAIFFSKARDFAYSASLGGWPVVAESLSPLKALLHSLDKENGFGLFNRGHYSSASLDKMIEKALVTMDDSKREHILKLANRHVANHYAIIPLYFVTNSWATKKGFVFYPRMDDYTLVMNLRPQ
jgi:peptide/nickel transport system substrate-binding protein